MSDQLQDATMAAAVDREKEANTRAEARRRAENLPWVRADDGSIVHRFMESRVDLAYLGPFRLGDLVVVNQIDVAGVIVYADQAGILVVPKVPRTLTTQGPGYWFPAATISSITPARNMDVPEPLRHQRFRMSEPTGEPDESLPMNPPPVQPGIEATF